MVADVQRWLDTANSQFGWLVKEVGETAEGTAKRFDSRENANSSFRPKLTIQYTAGNQAPTVANPLTTQYAVAAQAAYLAAVGVPRGGVTFISKTAICGMCVNAG